jgi:hypothetical protein
MSKIILLVLTAAVLSACSTAPTTQIAMKGNEVAMVKKRHDAKAGQFEKFTFPLQSGKDLPSKALRAVITAEKLRSSAEWRSTIVFCAETKASGASSCLSIVATADGKSFTPTVVEQAASQAPVANTPVPFNISATGSHNLDMVFYGDTLRMLLDDKVILTRQLRSAPDQFWFSCSSVTCAVDVYHPLPGATMR